MAALKTRLVANVKLMNLLLRAGLAAGSQVKTPIYDLHGKKLTFTAPAATVTFSDPTAAGLQYKDIVAQIKAAIATMNPLFIDGQLFLEMVTPAVITLNTQESQSTAARTFGFATTSGASTLSSVLYAPPDGAAPRLVTFAPGNQMDGIVVVTEE